MSDSPISFFPRRALGTMIDLTDAPYYLRPSNSIAENDAIFLAGIQAFRAQNVPLWLGPGIFKTSYGLQYVTIGAAPGLQAYGVPYETWLDYSGAVAGASGILLNGNGGPLLATALTNNPADNTFNVTGIDPRTGIQFQGLGPSVLPGPGGFVVIEIDTELMQVTAGGNSQSWQVNRGFLGSTVAAHGIGAQISVLYNFQWMGNLWGIGVLSTNPHHVHALRLRGTWHQNIWHPWYQDVTDSTVLIDNDAGATASTGDGDAPQYVHFHQGEIGYGTTQWCIESIRNSPGFITIEDTTVGYPAAGAAGGMKLLGLQCELKKVALANTAANVGPGLELSSGPGGFGISQMSRLIEVEYDGFGTDGVSALLNVIGIAGLAIEDCRYNMRSGQAPIGARLGTNAVSGLTGIVALRNIFRVTGVPGGGSVAWLVSNSNGGTELLESQWPNGVPAGHSKYANDVAGNPLPNNSRVFIREASLNRLDGSPWVVVDIESSGVYAIDLLAGSQFRLRWTDDFTAVAAAPSSRGATDGVRIVFMLMNAGTNPLTMPPANIFTFPPYQIPAPPALPAPGFHITIDACYEFASDVVYNITDWTAPVAN